MAISDKEVEIRLWLWAELPLVTSALFSRENGTGRLDLLNRTLGWKVANCKKMFVCNESAHSTSCQGLTAKTRIIHNNHCAVNDKQLTVLPARAAAEWRTLNTSVFESGLIGLIQNYAFIVIFYTFLHLNKTLKCFHYFWLKVLMILVTVACRCRYDHPACLICLHIESNALQKNSLCLKGRSFKFWRLKWFKHAFTIHKLRLWEASLLAG